MFLSQLRRHEGWLTFLLVLVLLAIGFTSFQFFFATPAPTITPTAVPVAQAGENSTLVVYPDRGPAGAYIGVTGTGWPGETLVLVLVTDDQGRSDILARSTTAPDGTLSTGFLYPFDARWQLTGTHTVIAETEAGLQLTTPFLVSTLPATTVLPPTIAVTATPIVTPTVLPTATSTETPTATPSPVPSPIPTDTPVPPPAPADTAVPPSNQPPQVQAALVPIAVNGDRDQGRFQMQIEATDPDGNLQTVLTILLLPRSEREREPRLREDNDTEIRFSDRQLEIRGPDPQALLDQIVAYGGIVLQEGQIIDLRIRNREEEKLTLRDDGWRLEAGTLDVAIIAVDAAGLSSTVVVNPCQTVDCRAPADANRDDSGDDDDND